MHFAGGPESAQQAVPLPPPPTQPAPSTVAPTTRTTRRTAARTAAQRQGQLDLLPAPVHAVPIDRPQQHQGHGEVAGAGAAARGAGVPAGVLKESTNAIEAPASTDGTMLPPKRPIGPEAGWGPDSAAGALEAGRSAPMTG